MATYRHFARLLSSRIMSSQHGRNLFIIHLEVLEFDRRHAASFPIQSTSSSHSAIARTAKADYTLSPLALLSSTLRSDLLGKVLSSRDLRSEGTAAQFLRTVSRNLLLASPSTFSYPDLQWGGAKESSVASWILWPLLLLRLTFGSKRGRNVGRQAQTIATSTSTTDHTQGSTSDPGDTSVSSLKLFGTEKW